MNKRRLGNFLLLKETLNIKVGNKPPEEKVELYFNDSKQSPNTYMIRELKDFFTESEKEVRTKRKRKTDQYWIDVYKSFLDKREEEIINFALERWKVSELEDNISRVKLNSFRSDNSIYDLVYEKKSK